jgi:hypothetical protein
MIFKGEWLAHDAVVHSHSVIRQDEKLLNLVRIDQGGQVVRQVADTTSAMVALARGDGYVHAAADLTAAYDGHDAVQKVERELVFLEPDCVVVFDRVTTAPGTTQTWQLNSPKNPAVSGARATFAGAAHTLRVERVMPASATTAVHSWASDSEYDGGYRLDAQVAGGTNQFLHVLWLDGAVGTVTRSDAGGKLGVAIGLAGGKTATVRFSPTGVDGTLAITGGPSVDLVPGVAALPE